jgi:hypothetical protein
VTDADGSSHASAIANFTQLASARSGKSTDACVASRARLISAMNRHCGSDV